MVDLARQAFSTNNFDLAAEIYERQIKETGPSRESYLGLADSYARSGQLKRAFESYSQAYRLGYGTVNAGHLNHLVTALINIMSDKKEEFSKKKGEKEDDIFACVLCKGLWRDPVSIGCGHTFCRKCLEKEQSKTCKKCGLVQKHSRLSSLKTNVLLSQCSEKWFPNELKAMKLKDEGNKHFENSKFDQAVSVYTEAFNYAPNDHLLASNRSYAYSCLESYNKALEDANLAVKLRPDWPKGYYRRGLALSGLAKHEEAAFAHLQCLALDSTVVSARKCLAKSLHCVLAPLPPSDVKRAQLSSYLNPTALSQVLNVGDQQVAPNFHLMSEEAILGLKESLRESLCNAGVLQRGNLEESFPPVQNDYTKLLEDKRNKSHSAPNSPPTSPPLVTKISRSKSDTSSLLRINDTLSRKRSSEDLSRDVQDWPLSPSMQGASPKLARSEPSMANQREVAMDLRDKSDFECTLCYRLLIHPVTTPCGHVFCRQCLDRCLDHSSMCPLCKSSLVEYLAERRQAVTEAVENVIFTYFPEEFEERKKQEEEDIAILARMGSEKIREIPIFVCTLSFPKIPCPLHIFEPRYRLMVRQCMESGTRQFGMCICLEDGESFANYGTILEIRDVQYFPDGRSVVDTVGGRRFKVLGRGHRDGYDTAKVELIEDTKVEDAQEREDLMKLHSEVHKEATDWFNALPHIPKLRILQHFGEFPPIEQEVINLSDGPAWAWWLIAVLPLDPRAQLSITAMTSLKERLMAVHRVLNYVQRANAK